MNERAHYWRPRRRVLSVCGRERSIRSAGVKQTEIALETQAVACIRTCAARVSVGGVRSASSSVASHPSLMSTRPSRSLDLLVSVGEGKDVSGKLGRAFRINCVGVGVLSQSVSPSQPLACEPHESCHTIPSTREQTSSSTLALARPRVSSWRIESSLATRTCAHARVTSRYKPRCSLSCCSLQCRCSFTRA